LSISASYQRLKKQHLRPEFFKRGENGKSGREMVSVVIPAYNEEAGLTDVVCGLRLRMESSGRPFEIIVVDDGSRDGTLAVARRLDATVISHATNRGYGAALKTGIHAARGEYILICDADGTYPSESIPELLRHIDGHDMVVAARTGESVDIQPLRWLAKGILRRLAIYLSETAIPDLNSGLRVFRRDAAIHFFPIIPNGFSFTTTITLAMLCNEGAVHYVPINYSKRTGRSKIHPVWDTLNFFMLVVRTILYFNPLKVFLPAAIGVGALFLGSFAYDVFVLRDLTEKTLILLFGAANLLSIGIIADLITKRLYGFGGWQRRPPVSPAPPP
jgi:glycosyltransferase involved in cell wall biosynthesis